MSEAQAAGAKTPAAPAAYRFGFCATEASHEDQHIGDASAWHRRCPGAVDSPRGLILCVCTAHGDHRKCHVCLTEVEPSEEYDATRRQHVDPEACLIADEVRRQSLDNTLARQLAQLQVDKAAQRAADRETTNAARATRGEKPVRVRREKPQPQRCHCGCAGMTKGGRFVPGHDAKLKSRLAMLDDAGTDDRGHANWIAQLAERVARGWVLWPMPVADPVLSGEVEEYIADAGGPEAVIEQAVKGRY